MFSFFKHSIKPYDTGYVPVGQGHELFYQQFGNPKGEIVLSFHGGPGGKSKSTHATHYDLKKYRIILFDQRGCGLSKYTDAFKNNTTMDTVHDGMKILNYLKIKGKITVAGASFGSGLAIIFAETYPTRVKQLIVNSVFLMRPDDAAWVTSESRFFYPDLIDEMRHLAKSDNLVPFFYKKAFSDKYADIQMAQKYLGSFERELGSLTPAFKSQALTDTSVQSMRIYFHYEKNNYFISKNQIIENIDKIKSIPTLIIHNRLDFICPVYMAYDLHQALPKSRLVIVPDKGHASPLLFKILDTEIKKL
ncbi:MAG: alpha/beta fold hydrolase [Pseudomonadota bacterium]|nr:alpha/beta fold hydrolase [Pseudomonadota bacterium]